jgi:hypothetical protein
MRSHTLPALILLSAAFSAPQGQASEAVGKVESPYATRGWNYMICSALASYANKQVEARKLFREGYRATKVLGEGIRDGKITVEEASHSLPIQAWARLQGPSPDFIAGRLFEAAHEEARALLGPNPQSEDDLQNQRALATSEFGTANCVNLLAN